MAASGITAFRNPAVYHYRMSLISQISVSCYADIDRQEGWMWRYDMFDSVSYSKMILKFWKPLDSFYPNKSFINPESRYANASTNGP